MTCHGMGLEVEPGSTSGEGILREVEGVEDDAETRTPDSAYELQSLGHCAKGGFL